MWPMKIFVLELNMAYVCCEEKERELNEWMNEWERKASIVAVAVV